MSVYVWQKVAPVSGNSHNGGGLLIAADTVEGAREVWAKYVKWTGLGSVKAASEPPDEVFETPLVGAVQVMVFPDAGCC